MVIIRKGESTDPTQAQPRSYMPIYLLNTLGKLQKKLLYNLAVEQGLHPASEKADEP